MHPLLPVIYASDLTINLASWSSGSAFFYGVGGLRLKFLAGQIGRSVAYGWRPLQHFFERSCVAHTCNNAEMVPVNSLYASGHIMKDLI